MKKFVYSLCFVLTIIFFGANIDAACKDMGENYTHGVVKSEYDCSTGILTVYGGNKNGNLGTGNKNDVSEAAKFTVNSKIGNRKITDYFISLNTMYVLTSDGKVYTSGYAVGDSLKGVRTTFINMVFYNNSANKITSIEGKSTIGSSTKGFYEDEYEIKFKTANSKKYYYFSNYDLKDGGSIPQISTNKIAKAMLEMEFYSYPAYIEKRGAYSEYLVETDRNNKLLYRSLDDFQKDKYISWYYNKGILAYKYVHNAYKNEHRNYDYNKKGQVVKRYVLHNKKYSITTYKNKKKVIMDVYTLKYPAVYASEFVATKLSRYTYNKKEKITLRKNYKIDKNGKKKIQTKKEYKYSKKGKRYYYMTYYNKRGKAYKTYYYQFNKKGKVINKRLVKTRK